MAIERIVRPFQTQDFAPADIVPTSAVVGVKNLVISVGRAGSVKTMSGSYSFEETFYLKKVTKEEKKTS